MEERISGIGDKMEGTDTLGVKSKKKSWHKHPRNFGYLERPIIKIIGIEEGEETQVKSTRVFNKVIQDNFPNLKKEMPMKVQEAYRMPNMDQKWKST